jgi:arginyl-tRNA synthetase
MASILSQLDLALRQAIKEAFNLDADPQLGHSQNPAFGDYQSNAAMGLAKSLGQKPRAIAEQIKAKLNLSDIASEISIAGPGFINIRLSSAWLAGRLDAIRTDERLGIEKTTGPQTVVVDYSGPNIAKEMHVGNLRSTIIGDAISRVLEFEGHEIIRQNHLGDWGTQFGMLIAYAKKSGIVLVRHIDEEQPSLTVSTQEIRDLETFYRDAKAIFDSDPAFQEAARREVVALQAEKTEQLAIWANIVNQSRMHFQEIYDRLKVKLREGYDERGESAYRNMLSNVVADLKAAGIAVESQGAIVVEVPGFESPLIVQKSDGGYLYSTTDLAAVRYRAEQLHANRIIYTHDSRQSQHFAQVFWTARKAGWVEGVELEYAPFGTMLGEDGKPFKTRTGGTVKLKDLLVEAEQRAMAVVTEKNPQLPESTRTAIAHSVGIGAVKYADLSKDRISDYVFSFDKMLALDGNTAPYLQYAHARIRSIFRKTDEKPGPIRLESPFELALAKHILRLGEVIEVVGRELKPHLLCTYLYELATRFSGFYENCPVLQSDPQTRSSRLALCELTARTMEVGLDLLGIEQPDQM